MANPDPIRLKKAPLLFALLLSALTTSCGQNAATKATEAFVEADFAAAVPSAALWTQQNGDDPAGHFVLSVSHYFLTNDAAAIAAREQWKAIGNDAAEKVRTWIGQHSSKRPWLSFFLAGVAAELGNQPAAALTNYAAAAKLEPNLSRLRHNASAIDSNLLYTLSIEADNPVTFKGNMWVEDKRFVPVDPKDSHANFTVTGGGVRSTLGELTLSAKCRGWQYVKDKNSGKIASWAVTLSKGKLLVSSLPLVDDDFIHSADPKDAGPWSQEFPIAKVDCRYELQCFDYLGKYLIVDVDRTDDLSFPLFTVLTHTVSIKNGKLASETEPKFLVGAEFTVNPEVLTDAESFIGGHSLIMAVKDGRWSGEVKSIQRFWGKGQRLPSNRITQSARK